MNAVDTNILIYAHDPRDVRKQEAALAIIETLTDGALLWQVACEYLSASRKLEPFGFRLADAWENLRDLQALWTPVLPTWGMHERAERAMNSHGVSFWDAMPIAGCAEAKVSRLYTEDFGDVGSIEGVEIVNPLAIK